MKGMGLTFGEQCVVSARPSQLQVSGDELIYC